jgi:hypothetical protein
MDTSKNCEMNYLLIRGGREALYQHDSPGFQHSVNFRNQLIPKTFHLLNERQNSADRRVIERQLPT